jgi:CopG family transcriptional regulator / antitoxin EndoAI
MIKTIQMTLDESLLQRIDEAVQEIGTNRSAFIREAVELALQQMRIRRLEAQQIAGYREQPVQADEIDEWDAIRVWGEA